MADDEQGIDPGRPPLIPRLSGEAREKALADPGPSWKEWFFASFARTWLLLVFLILDLFLLEIWAVPLNLPLMLSSLVLALYAEFFVYQYLWHQPRERRHHRSREAGAFRPTWWRPVEYGRWTPEWALAKAGQLPSAATDEDGPDPREFL